MRCRLCCAAVLLVAMSGVMAGSASAATRFVDDDRVQCASAAHTTIAAAVAAARANDELRVCPGLYNESLVLPESKPGLRLVSTRRHEAVLRTGARAPDSVAATVTALGSNALISGFTFRSDAQCDDQTSERGIYAPGTAQIVGNRFIKLAADCDRGYIPVSLGSSIDGDHGFATIAGNDFRAGTNRGSGTGGTALVAFDGGAFIRDNTFVGRGIVIGEGSFARIERNTISLADVGIGVDFFTSADIADNRLIANRVGVRDFRQFSTFPDPENSDPRKTTGNAFERNTIAHETGFDAGDLLLGGNRYVDNGSLAPRALTVDGVVRRSADGETLTVAIEASCPVGAGFFLSVRLEQEQPTFNDSSSVLQTDDVTCRGTRRVSYAFELAADGIAPGPLSMMQVALEHDGGGPPQRNLTVYRTGVVR